MGMEDETNPRKPKILTALAVADDGTRNVGNLRIRYFLRSELDFDCPTVSLILSVEGKLMTGTVAPLATIQAMAIWAIETPLWLEISSTLLRR